MNYEVYKFLFLFVLLHNISYKIILVRTIIELVTNENFYQTMYSQYLGPIDIAIKAICKNYTFSELYEIVALCSVLRCNIRSIYPKLDIQSYMTVLDNVFAPAPPMTANYDIAILWSHLLNEKEARGINNGAWSPNHFVLLLLSSISGDSIDASESMPLAVVSYPFLN